MFNFFKPKKAKENNKSDARDIYQGNKRIESNNQSFEDKVVYIPKHEIEDFPVGFEYEKYFTAAKKAYELSRASSSIKAIEFKGMSDAGECCSEIINDKLQITIRISCFKLGIVANGGYLHEYSKEYFNDFLGVFTHELFHAENNYDIAKNGVNIYKEIKNDTISNFGFHISSEYYACRKTAEMYKIFDTPEKIEQVIALLDSYIKKDDVINGKGVSQNVSYLYYKLATLCAFAEASNDDKWITVSPIRSDVVDYIKTIKATLNTFYEIEIHEKKYYEELGNQLIISIQNYLQF